MMSSDISKTENTGTEAAAGRILESHLECQICLSLICEPVTIPCGHTFCRVCLVQALRRSNKQCVTCRSICHVVAENANEVM